jgi:adenosylcobinamide-GDP ribazoletransferase
MPLMLVAIMLVITIEGFSGFLHLDGLADTMDGFLSSRPRSQVLDIMRDSRNGTMGVAAIVSVMLIKSAVFGSLSGDGLWHTALLMPLAGRCSLVLNMSFLPYARPEGGLATIFYKSRPKLTALWSTVMLLAIAWFTAGLAGLIAAAASLAGVALFAIWCSLKIGGATGDTLGAGCEISEAVLGLAFVAATFSGA